MSIIVGQIRDLQDAKYGGRLIIRHLPKFPFWIPEELYKAISNRCFRELSELEPTDQPSRNRLVAIMTVEKRPSGSYAVNDLAIMRTNHHWLPIWSRFGGQLADKLIADKRQFMKSMRFDAARAAATPYFLLLDTGSHPAPCMFLSQGKIKLFTRQFANKSILYGTLNSQYGCGKRSAQISAIYRHCQIRLHSKL